MCILAGRMKHGGIRKLPATGCKIFSPIRRKTFIYFTSATTFGAGSYCYGGCSRCPKAAWFRRLYQLIQQEFDKIYKLIEVIFDSVIINIYSILIFVSGGVLTSRLYTVTYVVTVLSCPSRLNSKINYILFRQVQHTHSISATINGVGSLDIFQSDQVSPGAQV